MKELHFEYKMKIAFDSPVERHRFTLKCVPRSYERQRIEELEIEVYPKEFLSEDEDSFGNYCIYGYSKEKHDYFSVKVAGKARTGLAPSERAQDEYRIGMYRYQTEITKPGPSLRDFARRISFDAGASALDKALLYMRSLYEQFEYVQGVTDVSTTAAQAGKGRLSGLFSYPDLAVPHGRYPVPLCGGDVDGRRPQPRMGGGGERRQMVCSRSHEQPFGERSAHSDFRRKRLSGLQYQSRNFYRLRGADAGNQRSRKRGERRGRFMKMRRFRSLMKIRKARESYKNIGDIKWKKK